MAYTRQTPLTIRAWLNKSQLGFPEAWTLNEVSEESRRRYLAQKWSSEIEAVRSIAHWAGHKLATCRDFSAEHWEWIAGSGPFAPQDHYARLTQILEPAFAQGPGWRSTQADRSALLLDIGAKARELIRLLDTEARLDVDLRDVAGLWPGFKPLLDYEASIQQHRAGQVQEWTWKRRAGEEATLPPPEHPGFLGAPRLSDYLEALLAKVLGKCPRATPRLRALLPEESSTEGLDGNGDADDDMEIAWEQMSEFLGADMPAAPFSPTLLRSGGDFGGYPKRQDALRGAVIRAFPKAIFERTAEPPKAPPAAMIETACIAWFGNSPTQKEINTMIKPERDRRQKEMAKSINSAQKQAALRQRLEQEGLTENEISQNVLRSFLDEDGTR